MSGGLAWKLNRLRTMSLGEIGYRARGALVKQAGSRGIGLAMRPPAPADEPGGAIALPDPALIDPARYLAAADRVLAGYFDIFALKACQLGFPPEWNRDPKTKTLAPLAYGAKIDYRDARLVGDIKYLWEPARHLELVTLAQAFYLSGQARYAAGCRTLLDSWFEQCPYPRGPHWTNGLELGIRLLNWAFAWRLLGGGEASLFAGQEGGAFKRRWLGAVYRHCHFVAAHLSKYSSANNHLFGELMGLFVAATVWPHWPASARWLELGRAGLEREAVTQNWPDGVNGEQATWYHHEVADMMLIVGLVGRANGGEFSAAFWSRLEAMCDFIAALMDTEGNVPMIGDSDDAMMLRLSQEPDFSVYRSLLASGAALFKRGDFKRKAGRFDDKSLWLLGREGRDAFAALAPAQPGPPARRHFPEGGYTVLGARFDTEDEVRIVFDAAPLGWLSIAAHGHADALSFTLAAGGRPLLIDPGTFAYHTERKWRDYFRGTLAHNTVRVDGLDQSVIGGNFMWLKKAHATLEQVDIAGDAQSVEAWHDGYRRLADPVTHRRRLGFVPSGERGDAIAALDTIDCAGSHTIEISWHIAPGAEVSLEGVTVRIVLGRVRLIMTMPGSDLIPSIAIGRIDPPLGWVSPALDVKSPIAAVVWKGVVTGKTAFETAMRIEFIDAQARI